jgi:transcriptional regulator with GAF, ATPase, and Fis domain
LQRLPAQLKKLQEHLDLLTDMARRDFLAQIQREAGELNERLADGRLATVLTGLIDVQPPALNHFCESLLDRVIEVTGAERGFILSYLPESTEAEVIASRHCQTTNLSLEEYRFSRTLLYEAFKRGEPLLVEDASSDPTYSNETSVMALDLKSVLAVPLTQGGRTVGALYLENNQEPCAFDGEDLRLLESVAGFVMVYLHHAHWLPVVFRQDAPIPLDPSRAPTKIIGRHLKIQEMLDRINRIADAPETENKPAAVLIEGETGTGKDLVARALHSQSARRKGPFVAINCAGIQETVLESAFFGSKEGVFTSAVDRIGLFKEADGGTIFLDEVNHLPASMQANLLRVLDSNEIRRVGEAKTIHVNVRVVLATSEDLKKMVEDGMFLEPLFYRLHVIKVCVPPLRERKEDIRLLIDHFLQAFSAIYRKEVRAEPEVYEYLQEYPFPGNVRQLKNLIEPLVIFAKDGWVRLSDLPPDILAIGSQRVSLKKDPLSRMLHTPPADVEDRRRGRKEVGRVLAEQERQLVERAVQDAGGNLTEAANRLGIHRVTLHKRLKKR